MRGRRFGTIRQLPSGRFQAGWRGPDRHMHNAPDTFERRSQAEAWLSRVQGELAEGNYVDERRSALSLAAFIEEWRPTVVDLRASTLVRDMGYVDRYIVPELGHLPLAELEFLTVAAWVARLRARQGDAELAPATIVKAAQILAKICDVAVDAGRMRTNHVRKVKLPRIERSEMRILTDAEIVKLADAIDGRYRALVIVGCHTGLRFGELAALTVGDVDLIRRRVTVMRTVTDLGELHVGNVKTSAGRRVVPLDDDALEALAQAMPAPHETPDGTIVAPHADDLIFEAPNGGYIRLNGWRSRFWAPAVKAAGLDGFRIHDMRHTAISLWVAASTDPVKIASYAGHRSVVTVLDRYGHLRPDHFEEHLANINAYNERQRRQL